MSLITVSKPYISKEEINAVVNVLKSGQIVQGPKVLELEQKFANLIGTKYCLALNSGTAALHCAIYGLNIKTNDEVITTPFTFVATANPILMEGAKPVFVDIDETTFNINTKLIKQKINENTKAILPVHLYGLCSNMFEINKLAKEYNLKVIEDACQAHLSKYNNIFAGNLGDVGAFSLYATKNMMCGEGGLLTTNSEDIYNKVKRFRQHGMNQVGNYDYLDLGYNYRLTDIAASIALVQLNKLEKFTKKRQSNARFLIKELKNITGLILPHIPKNQEHCWHQFTIRITSDFSLTRDEFVTKLKEEGIIPGIYYPKPLHLHPNFVKLGYKEGDFPVAEKLAKEVVSLPVHPQLKKEDLIKLVNTIKKLGALK